MPFILPQVIMHSKTVAYLQLDPGDSRGWTYLEKKIEHTSHFVRPNTKYNGGVALVSSIMNYSAVV